MAFFRFSTFFLSFFPPSLLSAFFFIFMEEIIFHVAKWFRRHTTATVVALRFFVYGRCTYVSSRVIVLICHPIYGTKVKRTAFTIRNGTTRGWGWGDDIGKIEWIFICYSSSFLRRRWQGFTLIISSHFWMELNTLRLSGFFEASGRLDPIARPATQRNDFSIWIPQTICRRNAKSH